MGVEVRQNADGDHELGAEIRGAFIPFVTKSGGYVDSLVTRYEETKAAEPAKPKRSSGSKTADKSGDAGDAKEGAAAEGGTNDPTTK